MSTETILTWLREHGVAILFIILFTFVAYRLLGVLTRAATRRIQALDGEEDSELDKRTATIFNVIHSTGLVLVVGTAIMMVLTELGVPVAPVLASVGFVGLAFGLGAQTLVKDMISGLFILLENQYTVGDVVELSGVIGTVEDMTLRTTEVRDFYGTLHTIPNGEIRVVSNRTRDWSRAVVDVNVSYEVDIERAVEALNEIGVALQENEAFKELLLEAPIVTGVEGLEEWAVRLRIMVRTEPNQHWGVQRYLRQQIRDTFAERDIDLALPRTEMHILERVMSQSGRG